MFNTESFDGSLNSFTFGDSYGIDHFVVSEDLIDGGLFFEHVITEIDFFSDGSSVNLNFEKIVFLLS